MIKSLGDLYLFENEPRIYVSKTPSFTVIYEEDGVEIPRNFMMQTEKMKRQTQLVTKEDVLNHIKNKMNYPTQKFGLNYIVVVSEQTLSGPESFPIFTPEPDRESLWGGMVRYAKVPLQLKEFLPYTDEGGVQFMKLMNELGRTYKK